MGFESKVFSYSHVSVHNTSKDCWIIINAKAFNVTNFLDDHPGGEEVLLAAAGTPLFESLLIKIVHSVDAIYLLLDEVYFLGKDASEEFENAGHGSAARLMLDEFYVGEVDPSTNPTPAATIFSPPQPEYDSGKTLESINKILYLLVPLGIMAVAIGLRFYN